MTIRTYKRLELAENQLKTAIGLFLAGADKFSVITLAGAADVIFCQLVLNTDQENFTDLIIRESGGEPSKETRACQGREINDLCHINDLKHMEKGEDGFIDMDVDECALTAILKALPNYIRIIGHKKDFVKAFLLWVRQNLDPKKYNIHCDPNWKPST